MKLKTLSDFKNKYRNQTVNIFLRCDDISVKKALNLKDASDQEIFSKLRGLKDTF